MTKSKCTSQFHWLGLQDFKSLEAEQKKLVPAISGSQKVLVFGTEFYPVLTLGVRGKLSEDLFATEQVLKNQGLEIVKTDRGGQATIHSPGQLILPDAGFECLSPGHSRFCRSIDEGHCADFKRFWNPGLRHIG